ncbi:putative arginyltransferase [Helianthus annuus]|nr:putative arginyltransferase [Helianthus annuus]
MADKKKIKSEASSSTSTIENVKSESVVVDVGRRRSSCGYCKSGSDTSITHGLWAHSLTVYDYQALLDRGWRRSGCFLYKPEMEKTCCPSYTIRLKATDFVPSKEQVRVSKRMQRFLDGSLNIKNSDEHKGPSSASSVQKDIIADNVHSNNVDQKIVYLSDQINSGPAISHGSSSNNPEKFQVKRQNLEIRLKRSTFDREEYELYRKYQIKVHNDTPDHVTESSYKRFLIDSPLIFVQPNGDSTVPSCGFGSFHQQYLVNGKLIAVGVIDILPKCLSSKYLFWDPDLAFLSLGKYSALQEINWVKESQRQCPSLQYYYLGYYIHSCNKMRYKAAYRPSELLCPLRYEWVSFDIAKRLLDRKPYVVLSDFATLQNEVDLLPDAIEDQIEQEYDRMTFVLMGMKKCLKVLSKTLTMMTTNP